MKRVMGLFTKDIKTMDGLLLHGLKDISKADDLAGEVADKQVLDAAVVGAAQSVEHHEIARYGSLIAWADELGRDDVVRLLMTNLNEVKAADKKLSSVALRKGVNRKAAS